MAIYRIYPEKDTYINSKPTVAGLYGNAGLDEILEIAGYPDPTDAAIGRTNRTLIQFRTTDIANAVDNIITGSISASIHLSLANASELPASYTINAYPISQSWTNGTGRGSDTPVNRTGCSWQHRGAGTNTWDSLGSDFISNGVSGSITNDLTSTHDLDIDVTNIISSHYSSSLPNNGILLKLEDAYENYTSQSISLKYFSADTNTIFPPYLEFKYDDSSYSSTLTELDTDVATVSIKNNKEKYSDSDIVKFRVSARPKYPTRTFTTGSIYLTEYKLPQQTYYGIKDEFSGEMIVDFDTAYTKVSADNTSCYFNIYMDSFQPERHYRLLIKSVINGSTVVFDNKNIFKVVRHG